MSRNSRTALPIAAVVLLAVSGTVLAGRGAITPDRPAQLASSHEPEVEVEANDPPTADELAHAMERLRDRGIPFEDAVLADLASRYGLGGAVRLLAWAEARQVDVEEIAARRDGTDTVPGMGWGRIARELGLHPGIGSVMGNGHGRAGAPGQLKAAGED